MLSADLNILISHRLAKTSLRYTKVVPFAMAWKFEMIRWGMYLLYWVMGLSGLMREVVNTSFGFPDWQKGWCWIGAEQRVLHLCTVGRLQFEKCGHCRKRKWCSWMKGSHDSFCRHHPRQCNYDRMKEWHRDSNWEVKDQPGKMMREGRGAGGWELRFFHVWKKGLQDDAMKDVSGLAFSFLSW